MGMVGFNRRFAPQVQRMHALLAGVPGPKSLVMTVNAGAIPPDHWTQDRAVGGGRLVGEACHFVDLLRFLAGTPITQHQVLGTIVYLANGSKAFPKERLEVFAGGRVLQLDKFRRLGGCGWPGFSKMNLWRQAKGQSACAAAFLQAVRAGGPGPIAMDELVDVGKGVLGLGEGLG